MDDLLTELKGLCAEMAQSSSATIKTQLLVARLQVEEQRIEGIAKQISDLEQQLSPVRQGLAAMTVDIRRFDEERRLINSDPGLPAMIERIKVDASIGKSAAIDSCVLSPVSSNSNGKADVNAPSPVSATLEMSRPGH